MVSDYWPFCSSSCAPVVAELCSSFDATYTGPTPTELADERKRKAEKMKREIEVSSFAYSLRILRQSGCKPTAILSSHAIQAGIIVPDYMMKKDTPKEALFKTIVEEIDERSSHMVHMESLGGQAAYDVVRMRGEIAQRLRELERIDHEKAKDFMNRI